MLKVSEGLNRAGVVEEVVDGLSVAVDSALLCEMGWQQRWCVQVCISDDVANDILLQGVGKEGAFVSQNSTAELITRDSRPRAKERVIVVGDGRGMLVET